MVDAGEGPPKGPGPEGENIGIPPREEEAPPRAKAKETGVKREKERIPEEESEEAGEAKIQGDRRKSLFERSREYQRKKNAALRRIDTVPIAGGVRENVAQSIRQGIESNEMTAKLTPEHKQALFEEQMERFESGMRMQLRRMFEEVFEQETMEEREAGIFAMQAFMSDLVQQGVFEQSKYQWITEAVDDVHAFYEQELPGEGREDIMALEHELERSGVIGYSEEQKRLLLDLSNYDRFKERLRGYIDDDGNFNWEEFRGNVQELFPQVLNCQKKP